MLLTPVQIKPKSFESRRNSFFHPGWMRLMFMTYVAWALGCSVTKERGKPQACSCSSSITESSPGPNSKHWFTTSFLQPLPYLVTS